MPNRPLNVFRVAPASIIHVALNVRRVLQFTKPIPILRPAGFRNRVRILLSGIGFLSFTL